MTDSRHAAPKPTKPARPDRGGVGGLVGAGPSVVGVSGSMRARDVSRPGPEHEAAAERDVVVRRRVAAGTDRPGRRTGAAPDA